MSTINMQVVALDELDAMAVRQFGGKVSNLASLAALGVTIPPGIAIGKDCLAYFLQKNGIDLNKVEEIHHRGMVFLESALAEAEQWQQHIIAALESAPFPHDLRDTIFSQLEPIEAASFAVRSSCVIEDSSTTSFAGQYATVLDVAKGNGILDAIRLCWASQYKGRVLNYALSRRGMPVLVPSMAILVQAMVFPEHAGVCFTKGPTPGTREYIIVESVPGLGDALVSGEVTPAHFEVSEDGRIRKSRIPPSSSSRPSDTWVLQIATESHKIAQHFGVHQDVEWAIAEGRLYILQARPITTLGEKQKGSPVNLSTLATITPRTGYTPTDNPLLDLRDDLHEWLISEIDPFVYRTIAYLLASQRPNGSWSLEFHPEWDVVGTAIIVQLLVDGGVPPGLTWTLPGLGVQGAVLGAPAAINWLVRNINEGGSWGTDTWDTCQVLRAMIKCGFEVSAPMIARAINVISNEVVHGFRHVKEQEWFGPGVYAVALHLFSEADMHSEVTKLIDLILGAQSINGEFLGPHHVRNTPPVPSVWHTAQAVTALAQCAEKRPEVEAAISRACAWLVSKQRVDGSWGVKNEPYSRYNTFFSSYALIALDSAGMMYYDHVSKAYRWLKGKQLGTGSFGDIASTLMAVAVMQQLHAPLFEVRLPVPLILRIQATLGGNLTERK